MDDGRIGRALRAIRHHLAWRQDDVAERSGVSQAAISLAERGQIDAMPLRRLRRIARALDADVVLSVRWRGGDLDRLLDEGHATLVGMVTRWLEGLGWDTCPEVTYSIYGERGSIDVLAWHAATRTLLVIEVKTELTSVEETLRRHDAKIRLAPTIAAERFGWQPAHIAKLLVLPNTATARRRVARHHPVLSRAYPRHGSAARRWIRSPEDGGSGLLFLDVGRGGRALARKRIRRRSAGGSRTERHDASGRP